MGETEFKTSRRLRAGFVELEPGLGHVLDAIDDGFTVTTRDICKMLQCSRSFADKDFPDLAKYIYFSGSHRVACGEDGKYTKRLSYELLEGFGGGRLYQKSSLDEIIAAGATVTVNSVPVWAETLAPSAAKRIRSIRVEYGMYVDRMEKERRDPSLAKLDEYKSRIAHIVDGAVAPAWAAAWPRMRSEFADPDQTERLRNPRLPLKKEASASWLLTPQKWDELDGWHTIADLMDYGDTQSEWHRLIARHHVLKLKLEIGDSTRIMYGPAISEPWPETADGEVCSESLFANLGKYSAPAELVPQEYGASLGYFWGLLEEVAESDDLAKFRRKSL